MKEPFKGFWERLHLFVSNVEVADAMSEEEKCMILSVCNGQTANKLNECSSVAEVKEKSCEHEKTVIIGHGHEKCVKCNEHIFL